jgi:hypothetical protein
MDPGCLVVQGSEDVASLFEHATSSESIGLGMSSEKYICLYNVKSDTPANVKHWPSMDVDMTSLRKTNN